MYRRRRVEDGGFGGAQAIISPSIFVTNHSPTGDVKKGKAYKTKPLQSPEQRARISRSPSDDSPRTGTTPPADSEGPFIETPTNSLKKRVKKTPVLFIGDSDSPKKRMKKTPKLLRDEAVDSLNKGVKTIIKLFNDVDGFPVVTPTPRGRPKKIKSVGVSVGDSAAETPAQTPRHRGRPRKVLDTASDADAHAYEIASPSEAEIPHNDDNHRGVSRTGRLIKKNAKFLDDVQLTDHESSTVHTATPKGRRKKSHILHPEDVSTVEDHPATVDRRLTSDDVVSAAGSLPYVDGHTGDVPATDGTITWVVGARLEAQDRTDNWYRARIIAVSEAQGVVRIHFDGWKARWDAWYTMTSERLRPLTADWVDPKFLQSAKKKYKKKKSVEQPEAVGDTSVLDTNHEFVPIDQLRPPLQQDAVGQSPPTVIGSVTESASDASAVRSKPKSAKKLLIATTPPPQHVRKNIDGSEKKQRHKHRDMQSPIKLTTKIKLGSCPKIISPDPIELTEKRSKREKKRTQRGVELEFELPEEAETLCRVKLEEVDEYEDGSGTDRPILIESIKSEREDMPAAPPPMEVSYQSFFSSESGAEEPEVQPVKRSSRKKSSRSEFSDDWASEELLDHVTMEERVKTKRRKARNEADVSNNEVHASTNEPALDQAITLETQSRRGAVVPESSCEERTEEIPMKKKRGRKKKVVVEAVNDQLASTDECVEEPIVKKRKKLNFEEDKQDVPEKVRPDIMKQAITHIAEEESPRKKKEKKKEINTEKIKKKKKKCHALADDSSDTMNMETGSPKRAKRRSSFSSENLQKGSDWKVEGDQEFMDIPPPSMDVPPPRSKIEKKLKKLKKLKKVCKIKKINKKPEKPSEPEYTDAYAKAMLAMSMAEAKEKRKLERRLQKLKEKELVQKKTRRGGPTAYMLFCNSWRTRLMAQNPGASFATISKKLGEIWHGVGEKEKLSWKRKAKKLREKAAMGMIRTGKYAKQAAKLSTLLKPTQRSTASLEQTNQYGGSPYKVVGTEPLDVAAHLKLLGESLAIIGTRLTEHKGDIAVQGTMSVLLDSFLCALGPLVCLTSQVPELDVLPTRTLSQTLDSVAYIMPGL